MTFRDFFHDLSFSCQFQKSKTFLVLGYFWPWTVQQTNSGVHQKCVPFALFNYSSLSYIALALSSAVTNLSNKTLIFHYFQGPTIKFHDFPGLENETLKFHDLTGFPWAVRTLRFAFALLWHKSIFLLIHDSLEILPFSLKTVKLKKRLKRSSLSKQYKSSDA